MERIERQEFIKTMVDTFANHDSATEYYMKSMLNTLFDEHETQLAKHTEGVVAEFEAQSLGENNRLFASLQSDKTLDLYSSELLIDKNKRYKVTIQEIKDKQ